MVRMLMGKWSACLWTGGVWSITLVNNNGPPKPLITPHNPWRPPGVFLGPWARGPQEAAAGFKC